MSKSAGGGGAAFNASAYVEERQVSKAEAAVGYYEREAAEAAVAVLRLTGKAEKLRDHADAAEDALEAAEAEARAAEERLADARRQLTELGG